jgi:hypothetical protein
VSLVDLILELNKVSKSLGNLKEELPIKELKTEEVPI